MQAGVVMEWSNDLFNPLVCNRFLVGGNAAGGVGGNALGGGAAPAGGAGGAGSGNFLFDIVRVSDSANVQCPMTVDIAPPVTPFTDVM